MSIYVMYKPYQMLSQFTKELPSHSTLADINFEFAKNVYPVGRLDADSEGLLILSDESALNTALLHPSQKQPKTYWVQVEGEPNQNDISPLQKGISIRINKKEFTSAPAKLSILPNTVESTLPVRNPPIRFRKNVQETWVEIVLTEGKNRQVRKLFAAIGFPVLRLVRVGIGNLKYGEKPIGLVQPGQVIEISKQQIASNLN